MRHFLPYCLLTLAIASCGAPEQPQAAPPTIAAPTITSLPLVAATPTIKRGPTPRPATPLPDSAYPTSTPLNATIPLDDLLFQPGDLPGVGITAQLEPERPEGIPKAPLEDSLHATFSANLSLDQDGKQDGYGRVAIFFYTTPNTIQPDYSHLINSLFRSDIHVPQPGIGERAMLLIGDNREIDGYSLLFSLCHTIAFVHLHPPTDQQTILAYGTRLAQRIDAVDCQGAAHAPLQTPAPVAAPATPVPPVAIVAHRAAQITLLPDTSCSWTVICAYTFVDINHGWLALGGTIVATSDGGANWHEQYHTDSRVRAITFVSTQRGWITMEHGYVLTEDGGATWQRVATSPSDGRKNMPQSTSLNVCSELYFWAFVAISPQTSWTVCASEPGTGFQAKQLFKTNDGGKNWQLIADSSWEKPDTIPATGYANDIFFLDAQHGWLAEGPGGLLATTDGGRSWRDVEAPGEVATWVDQLLFLSTTQGFAVAPSDGPRALFRTTNGTDWQPIYTEPASAPFPAIPTRFFSDGGGIGPGGGAFLKTTNSGASWAEVGKINTVCGQFGATIRKLSFADLLHGWAMLSCGSMPQPVLDQTTDGGATWAAINSPGTADNPLVGISLVDSQTGYVVLESGQLQRTDDGGMTWAAIPSGFLHTPNLSFATRDIGWELRGRQLFATQDGGRTWAMIGLDAPIRQFWLLPDGHAWVLATDGDDHHPATRLFTTVDGGQTWSESVLTGITLAQNGYSLDSNQLQFADDNHGWLQVGSQLYTTQDGGQSWVQVH